MRPKTSAVALQARIETAYRSANTTSRSQIPPRSSGSPTTSGVSGVRKSWSSESGGVGVEELEVVRRGSPTCRGPSPSASRATRSRRRRTRARRARARPAAWERTPAAAARRVSREPPRSARRRSSARLSRRGRGRGRPPGAPRTRPRRLRRRRCSDATGSLGRARTESEASEPVAESRVDASSPCSIPRSSAASSTTSGA